MRKYQQKLILTLLGDLESAHSEMNKQTDKEIISGYMADCRDVAVSIGECIEATEGEGTQTVTLLEEYLDLLFEAYNGEKGNKALRKHLIKIENSVRSELKPDRIEVAFFPYSPSKWDSLESIYLAAKEDPQCDAYVVPIPYYELNPDESFGALRYDGDKFPEDVPVIYWEDYDVEQHNPDIIYTHYAYDDNSSNINVHPDFYGKRLKQHCEILVHVPYFMESREDVTEYYGHLPGVLFADFVVVQSEHVRQEYMKQYNTFIADNKLTGMFKKEKDKFVALGSPKTDKAVNSKKEDFKLPSEWEKYINKPDGTQKKIILLNTHMWVMIAEREKYFNKLCYVFESFRNRDDVALWWRPHPNTEVNIKTKCPDLLRVYQDLVNEYLLSGIGIYDETPDLHRAIAWSDAYYGDWSSLVTLFHVTGKPVMLWNLDITDNQIPFEPSSFYVTDDSIWFTVRYFNALIKMNKKSKKLEFAGSFPGENSFVLQYSSSLYRIPVLYNDALWFPPLLAEEIAVYSLSGGSFEKIPYEKTYTDGMDFVNTATQGDDIYFIPWRYPAIIRLNTKTKELTYITDWIEPLSRLTDGFHFNKDGTNEYFYDYIILEDSIYFASVAANAVVEFDTNSNKSAIHEIGRKDNRYLGICYDGNNIWLSTYKNILVKWNPGTDEVKEIEITNDDIDLTFFPCVYCCGYVWLLPFFGAQALKIDVNTELISVANEFDINTVTENDQLIAKYSYVQLCNDTIYAFNNLNGIMVEYNCENSGKHENKLQYPPETISQLEPLYAEIYRQEIKEVNSIYECFYYEGGYTTLGSFMKYICKDDSETRNQRRKTAQKFNINTDGTSGKTIYNHFKKIVFVP